MDECREERIEQAEGGEYDADGIDSKRSDKVLHDDRLRPPCDQQRLEKAAEVVSERDDVGTLSLGH